MQKLNGSEVVCYNNNSLSVGGNSLLGEAIGVGNGWVGDFYYDHYHTPYYPIYYPVYGYCNEKSKIEQGFKIVGKMMENKIITKELTIKEFIKLVNDIAELL